ncbi:RNA polymerase sigma factor [Tenacibaculum amylolyticum]|uniref:RNA polymerase sigma factor n=1 Tax=Tenacibaculum amylolyticum TaxID=104269 RepID=UPI0038939E4E
MKNKETYADKRLIEEYLNGNKDALVFLVRKWHQVFCSIAYSYVNNMAIAKDIAQESWITLIPKLETLEEPSKFKSWAIQIVKRKAIDQLRKHKREHKHMDNYAHDNKRKINEEDMEALEVKEKRKETLKKAIAELSLAHQQVIRLFYVEERSLIEMSELLGISTGTVKSRLFHAREKLKKILKS